MTRTVLIGLDGATFTLLDALMDGGVMPFLDSVVSSGVRADLRSTIPALTPPAWVSLATGRSPGQHGIFDFFRRESAASHSIRFLTSQDIDCETIWSLVNRYGLRATVLNFPLTFPAPAIDGYDVPGGWMPWRQLRLGCHPSDLYTRLKKLPGFNPRELAMDMEQEEKAIEGCRQDEYEEWVTLHIRRERQWGNVLRYLMETDPTELTAILFDGVDKLQHLCWRFLDPSFKDTIVLPWEQRVRDMCLDYFRELDGLLAEIVEQAGSEATVVMASDHGFGPRRWTFFANAWLAERGYLAWKDRKGPRATDSKIIGIGHLARHIYELDWEHTRAYVSMPSGNGIHIVRATDENPHGVADTEYEAFRNRLIGELLDVQDPSTGETVISQVWKREQVFAGPQTALAPDLTLELQDGSLVSILASDLALIEQSDHSGTHRPEGVLIAHGPGLCQGLSLAELSILDVAPLLLHSLNVPIPDEFEGHLPVSALVSQELGDSLAEVAPQPLDAPKQGLEFQMDENAEEEIARRLRALGYIE